MNKEVEDSREAFRVFFLAFAKSIGVVAVVEWLARRLDGKKADERPG